MWKSTRYITILVFLTGCYSADMTVTPTSSTNSSAAGSKGGVIASATNISQQTQSSCKALQSAWTTGLIQNTLYSPTLGTYANPAVPQNPMLGIEPDSCIAPGYGCGGGFYTLDLTTLGTTIFTVKVDYQDYCYYTAKVGDGSYVIETLNGCSNTTTCAKGVSNPCGCCPYSMTVPPGNYIGEVFDYTLSCNSLSVTDTGTGQTETYQ